MNVSVVGAEMCGVMSKETHIYENSPMKFKVGLQKRLIYVERDLQQTATDCNRLQQTATDCDIL